MPKRITGAQRKEMLRLYREEKTYAQIMDKMGIGDLRTLKKHLAVAEEEERVLQAEARILEDAQAKHLDEIRALIERWRDEIGVPAPGLDVFWVAPHCQEIRQIEEDLLFEGVKEHLPFDGLWGDYDMWRQEIEKYVAMLYEAPEGGEDEPRLKESRRGMYPLAVRLRGQLEEVLLRRDYVLHKCKLCPGQVRRR
jgi:hypothetical protein